MVSTRICRWTLVLMAGALAALAGPGAGHKDVLGFSGSNSKYMVIRDCEFYDNGAGLLPNTWMPEPNQPASDGVIEHNLIYRNNFDYFRPSSPVTTNNFDVKGDDRNFPVGAGVVLFGVSRWTVKRNAIFGNFLWGAAAFSDPTNDTGRRSTTTTGSSTTRWAVRSTTPTAPTSSTTAPARARALRTTGSSPWMP